MNKKDVAKKIIKAVGSEKNINNAWHCMTRLRFDLKDVDQVDYKELESIPGVMGTKFQCDQLQVVLGTNVGEYYNETAKILGLDSAQASQPKEKKGLVAMFMDTVSGVFGPIVPAIAGAGMIKGLIAGLAALNIISNQTDTYLVIDMLASGVFTFLPFFVAASAAKIFKTNPYLAIAIAATLQFPTMTSAAAAKEISNFMLFNFIPVPVFNYSGTVIPIIFAVLCLSYIYRWVDKMLPEVLRTVFTPTISLFVAGLLTLTVIGPIGIYLGNLLADFIKWIFSISPILGGIIFGAIRPIAIFTGLHHAMTPIALQNFANQGWDMLMPMMLMANMAITGATLAVYFKVNSQKEKSIVFSSAVSGLLGITEPALFGVLSKYKKAFIAATCGSAIASAFISFFGVRIYGYILSSIFSLPAYIGEYFVYAVLGILIALGSSFLIAYFLIKKPEGNDVKSASKVDAEAEIKDITMNAVAQGEVIALKNVKDEIFSSKMVGDGYAILPERGTVYSPVSGTVETVFPTKHAIGIRTNTGLEILIHMGIDTVELNGEGFKVFVEQGQTVSANQKIAEMDLEFLKNKEKDPTIMVLITNMDAVCQIKQVEPSENTEIGSAVSLVALK